MYKLPCDEINQKRTPLQQCQAKDNQYNSISCHLETCTCAPAQYLLCMIALIAMITATCEIYFESLIFVCACTFITHIGFFPLPLLHDLHRGLHAAHPDIDVLGGFLGQRCSLFATAASQWGH